MGDDVIVSIDGLWKRYSRSLPSAAWHGLSDSISVFLGREPARELRRDEFWSLADVTLEVRRGESVGLIGHNGAGKTTLLKTLSGLLRPDRGTVHVNGSMGWLVDIGAGLHPYLTGRENVLLRADMLGLKGNRRRQALDDVIEFARIGDFIDSPVSFFSSGMQARLGFGIATMIQPDLLIIDETLSVGDHAFRLKCYERVHRISRDSAVLFVSHNMSQVAQMCSRGIYLSGGEVHFDGSVQQTIAHHVAAQNASGGADDLESYNTERCSLTLIGARPVADRAFAAEHGDQIEFDLALSGEPAPDRVSVVLFDQDAYPVLDIDSAIHGFVDIGKRVRIGPYALGVKPGRYRVIARGSHEQGRPLFSSEVVTIEVDGPHCSSIVVQPHCSFRNLR